MMRGERGCTIVFNKSLLSKLSPYKPSVLFLGHRQAVQNQIPQNAASDQVLYCLLTESAFKI